jgi:hydroxymethylbilane synthase
MLDKPLPEIGGKGLFTLELESALLNCEVDAAVHSLKDLPTQAAPGLETSVIPERGNACDVLICNNGYTLEDLPAGAVVGTSSLRRSALILSYRGDLSIHSIRGNVDTRIRKIRSGQYQAGILASAGIERLGLKEHITQYLPLDIMLPAPGQGALAVQCRAGDDRTLQLLDPLDHTPTHQAVTAERAFLAALGGGCSLPVGAYAEVRDGQINLRAVVAAPDGSQIMRFSASGSQPLLLGERLAKQALEEGAGDIFSLEDTVG